MYSFHFSHWAIEPKTGENIRKYYWCEGLKDKSVPNDARLIPWDGYFLSTPHIHADSFSCLSFLNVDCFYNAVISIADVLHIVR